MEPKPKVVILKNMSSSRFTALIKKHRACNQSLEWAKGKDLRTVLKTCPYHNWYEWLGLHMTHGTTIYSYNFTATKIIPPPRNHEWGTEENYGLILKKSWDAWSLGRSYEAKIKKVLAIWRRYYKVERES